MNNHKPFPKTQVSKDIKQMDKPGNQADGTNSKKSNGNMKNPGGQNAGKDVVKRK